MNEPVVKPELLPVIRKTVDPDAAYGRAVRCPFHRDRSPSLHVYENQHWYCFGCGKNGDVFDLLGYLRFGDLWDSRNRGMFVEVLRDARLEGYASCRASQTSSPSRTSPDPAVLAAFREAAEVYHTALTAGKEDGARRALRYLASRGFRRGTIETLRIGYASRKTLHRRALGLPEGERSAFIERMRGAGLIREDREFFCERIIFPNLDASGNVLNLTGRTMIRSRNRYLNLPNVRRNLYLLGLADPAEPLYLTESVPDAVTLFQSGFAAAAVNGTALSSRMAESLAPFTQIRIVPQNDLPSVRAALSWCGRLPHCRIVLPDYIDGAEKDVNDILTREGEESCREKLLRAAAAPLDVPEYLAAVRPRLDTEMEKETSKLRDR